MTDLEQQGDDLWRKVIAKKFEHRCFICRIHDSQSVNGAPHSAHHLVKRRFHLCRYDINCGCYLCSAHHDIAERKNAEFMRLLEDIYICSYLTVGNAAYNIARSAEARRMQFYIEAHKNPAIVRYTPAVMAEIIDQLEQAYDIYTV